MNRASTEPRVDHAALPAPCLWLLRPWLRSKYLWLSPSIAFSMLLEFADFWMMRRMLLNLRERIEAAVPEPRGLPDAVPTSCA